MLKISDIFDQRNKNKKQLQLSQKRIFTNRGEIWMYKVWVNIWNEISKWQPFIRPCIILNNIWWDLILIIPLTTKQHNKKYYIKIQQHEEYWLYHQSFALINQIATISKKRLLFKTNAIKKENKRIKLIPKTILEEIKSEYFNKVFKI